MRARILLATVALAAAECPDYSTHSKEYHQPLSSGRYKLSYMRPTEDCRTFKLPEVEEAITKTSSIISDPDLRRLFENTYPNTLDTAVKWKGYANNDKTKGEELTFLITGDINAMWLRDSANQVQSYLPLLRPSNDESSLASLYRGVINLQARYVLAQPYCNSFQPPTESGIPATYNEYAATDVVKPTYDNETVFECKYEIDSWAAFLEVSTNYYTATKDATFFGKFNWKAAVELILESAAEQMVSSYQSSGKPTNLTYTFTRVDDRSSETQENDGVGNPFRSSSRLVRSFFRPSDDSTIFQGFIPGNMMFSHFLETAAEIAAAINDGDLAHRMKTLSGSLRTAISEVGIVDAGSFGKVYAYEVDGYFGQNIMDDANIPSLLSAPFFGYLDRNDQTYQNTRKLLLSDANPYWMQGPAFSAIGGAHDGPGYGWPMASIVRILTSDDDQEIAQELQQLVASTDGLGLIHESINAFNQSDYTRQWFSWANGLFGQCILDLQERKPDLLKKSYQGQASGYSRV